MILGDPLLGPSAVTSQGSQATQKIGTAALPERVNAIAFESLGKIGRI